ncbi:TetR family transcriptional regulator [Natranaerovirga pectinivora]|uniref:TetR family transcriptional regulator n=1 Tax=Natranaerovirga pectinivora TaxID=682400 RepID=A0A4R3MK05_9FIRM|nr:TetR/AcrR family transcriptional regulator [Natranaerovirga pectinivora]TCT14887.1 TetR family transcriptional regulator [Natranaerovirga pectinivora]
MLKSDKAKKTKRKILEAAEALFYEKDISKTSVNEIVEKAGVAKGTFYLYFESKDELAWSLVQKGVLTFSSELEKFNYAPITKETIDYFINKMLKFTSKNKKIIRMIHQVKFLEFIHFDKKNNSIEEQYISALKKWFDRGVAQSILNIKDTEFYARFIFIAIHEFLERIILGTLEYELLEVEEELKNIINKIIGW